MPQVNAELVNLLQELFKPTELQRLLQGEPWGAELVQQLPPPEHETPHEWLHELAVAVHQRGLWVELRALMLREREEHGDRIRAAIPEVDSASAVEVPPSPPAWNPIRVLHISDMHFSSETVWDADTVLFRLAADVEGLRREVGEIDLVVVTGDIADRGVAEEYSLATEWLTGPLAHAAGVTTAQIQVVPGNHDVNRGSIGPVANPLAKGLLAEDDPQHAIAQVLGSEKHRQGLLEGQAAFFHFAQTFHPGITAPWWFERHTIRGLNLHLAGFNSVCFTWEDDPKRLMVSRWQCNQLLTLDDDVDLSIALVHHSCDKFTDIDRESREAIRRRCGVVLHGHVHKPEAEHERDPDHDTLELGSGASYGGGQWPNSYQLLELDPIRGEARVHLRLWKNQAWIPDRNDERSSAAGVVKYGLRPSRRPHEPQPTAPTATPISESTPPGDGGPGPGEPKEQNSAAGSPLKPPEAPSVDETPVAEVTPSPPPPRPVWSWPGVWASVVILILIVVGAILNGGGATPAEPPPPETLRAAGLKRCGLTPTGGPSGARYKPAVKGLDMTFVALLPGQLCMGSAEEEGDENERPMHPVKVSGFMLGQSEVTQTQWRVVVEAAQAAGDVDAAELSFDPSYHQGDQRPVEQVSWCEAIRLANALSRLDGRAPVYEITADEKDSRVCTARWVDGAAGYRLPTEAEWEYAARAGTTTNYATGDDESDLASAGWYNGDERSSGNSLGQTHDVCTAPVHPWGLCDLHGNVWEFVWDSRGSYPDVEVIDPRYNDGGECGIRGGCWRAEAVHARAARREEVLTREAFDDVGFRLVLPSPEAP